MAKLIIIRAAQNSGKTTTAGLVYKELLKYAERRHSFNGKDVDKDSLILNDKGETLDFEAKLTINKKVVVIISAGDYVVELRAKIKISIEIDVDVIICCTRSVNRQGSAYRMILNEFATTNPIELEVFTKYSEEITLKYEVKKGIVDEIIKMTLETTRAGVYEN